MNNNTTTTENATESHIVGLCYVLFAIPFVVLYIIVNTALWRNKELFQHICYKVIFYSNICDCLQTFGSGVVFGAIELAASGLNLNVSKVAMTLFFSLGAPIPLFNGLLAISRLLTVTDRVPDWWLFGTKGHLVAASPFVFGIFMGSVYITLGISYNDFGHYERAYHIGISPSWQPLYTKTACFIGNSVSIVCHTVYFAILFRSRSQMSMEARKTLKLKCAYKLPVMVTTVKLTTLVFFYFIQPIMPMASRPGVVVNLIVVTCNGANGVLTLVFLKGVRNSVSSMLNLSKKFHAVGHSHELRQWNSQCSENKTSRQAIPQSNKG